jgi:hypothetical protein
MSSVVISGDTSGAITIAAPAVAGTYTQTLPQITGTLGTLNSGTAVASTSGTSIDFTSIPANVRRITVMFSGVSTSGASNIQIQFGTGGTPTYTTSGYLGTALASTAAGNSASNSTTGFVLLTGAAATIVNGIGIFTNVTGNTWAGTVNMGQSDSARALTTSASVPLSAALTAIRVTTVNGTDTFDAGSINILYE